MRRLLLAILMIPILTACGVESQSPVSTNGLTLTRVPTDTSVIFSTATLTNTLPPIPSSTIGLTVTPKPTNDPGFLITLGEESSGPWFPGVVLFSPDGTLVALATSRIRLWDTTTYQLVLELENPYPEGRYLQNAAFSDDGNYFAVSITNSGTTKESEMFGHLVVWDLANGNIIHDWDQEYAIRPGFGEDVIYVLSGMAFIPNSTQIAYASGNTILIRDVSEPNSTPEILFLGEDMFASQISVRDDSEYLFALRDPDLFRWENFKHQSWHLDPNYLNFQKEYTETPTLHYFMELYEDNLIYAFFYEGILEIENLTTNSIVQFPYPEDWFFFNSDFSLVLVVRVSRSDGKVFELWKTDTWEKIYYFIPKFAADWIPGSISFSPDNTMLAIYHHQQVTLYNINSIVNPETNQ